MAIVEPTITINGQLLSENQAATIRNAIEGMASDLMADGLGNDEHGRFMVKSYMTSIEEIRRMIFRDTGILIRSVCAPMDAKTSE